TPELYTLSLHDALPIWSERTTRRFYGSPVALYDAVADLAVEIDSYELERREHVISPEFTRVTTVVHLHGAGEEGVGEDVTYTPRSEEHTSELQSRFDLV